MSYEKIAAEITLRHSNICRATLIHYLGQIGYRFYVAANKRKITKFNKKKRLRWANEPVHWSSKHWRGDIKLDELRLIVKSNDEGDRVFCKAIERYNENHIVEATNSIKRSIMPGAGFMLVVFRFWSYLLVIKIIRVCQNVDIKVSVLVDCTVWEREHIILY